MNENVTSLVLFTVLCQTAVGALFFREFAFIAGLIDPSDADLGRITLFTILLILFISLSIAFFHLGNPFHAYHAVNNLAKSWLSREIFTLSLLIASIIINIFLSKLHISEKAVMVMSVLLIMISISLIISMIKLYMIPGVTTWNNIFTPVSFTITTLLCGTTLFALICSGNMDKLRSIALIFIAILIICSLANSIILKGLFQRDQVVFFIFKFALSLLSLFVVALILFRSQSNKTLILWVILFIIVFFSEIINRYTFFLSFHKSGL
jgi:anaerobic dimethyl sulfoxide reductase subunit C (anchor subunit)